MEERVLEGEVGTIQELEFSGEVAPQQLEPRMLSMQRTLAYATAGGYFSLLAIPFIFLLIGRVDVNETIDLIKTIAAILSGIVGMVWGFFFFKGGTS